MNLNTLGPLKASSHSAGCRICVLKDPQVLCWTLPQRLLHCRWPRWMRISTDMHFWKSFSCDISYNDQLWPYGQNENSNVTPHTQRQSMWSLSKVSLPAGAAHYRGKQADLSVHYFRECPATVLTTSTLQMPLIKKNGGTRKFCSVCVGKKEKKHMHILTHTNWVYFPQDLHGRLDPTFLGKSREGRSEREENLFSSRWQLCKY